MLHASAVAINGSALAFVGQSGRGKSTVAALLCVDGAELVTDDVLVAHPGPPVTCEGGASGLRLRAAASAIAEERPEHPTRLTADDRRRFRRRWLRCGHCRCLRSSSQRRRARLPRWRHVPPADAVFALLSFPRVHGWRQPDVLSRDFTRLSEIVNLIPVLHVIIPWGPPFDLSVAPALARLATGEHAAPPAGDRHGVRP